ncbi:MAG: RDD family protein [Acidimicrobiaceae bacterium]|nr:RDD family protein [Acidimicrobiaceae bacterium]
MSDTPVSQPPQDGWVTLGNGETFKLASRIDIGVAYFIDGALLLSPLMLIWMISTLFLLDRTGFYISSLAIMIFTLFAVGSCILYPIAMITSKGQTLGMKWARIKIVSAANGLYPTRRQLSRAWKESTAHRFRILSLPQIFGLLEYAKFLDECDVKVVKVRRH